MTQDDDAILQAHTVAATRLLLGKHKMRHGVVVTGGKELDFEARTEMAHAVLRSNLDMVALEFGTTADGQFGRTGITIYLPRDGFCRVYANCNLWLSKAGNRAVILPQPKLRGHFRLSPRELIHIDGKPTDDTADGIRRADAWLTRRMGTKFAEPANANFVSVREVA
ncbi:hypothetical protein [uncultured Sphingomonas sp.]|uniref:hypothetical protein n=1 Tax=uncultured Sphingomonas sp. TaxID=158754 RepID=UPI002590DC3C|nr:hypothetical protein [uncultured Sphingomonas sp.]